MKKILIIIVVLLIMLSLFILPFLFGKETNEKIVSGINLITGISSLLTLMIALLLFNKFGIEKSLLEKQAKLVFDLIENISSCSIFIEGRMIFMKFNPIKAEHKFYEAHYDKKIIFSIQYFEGLQNIWKFSENVFLPKKIAEKLGNLQFAVLSENKDGISDNELKVSAFFKSDYNEVLGKINDKEVTFKDFINDWTDLVEEIKTWIINNSSVKSDLNLQ